MAASRFLAVLLLACVAAAASAARPLTLCLPNQVLRDGLCVPASEAAPTAEDVFVDALQNDTLDIVVLNETIILTKELPVITRNLTVLGNCSTTLGISGQPCTISGNDTFGIFKVRAEKGESIQFVVKNLLLTNGSAERATAIDFLGGPNGALNVSTVSFKGNNATGTNVLQPGSVISTDGNLTLEASAFIGNSGPGAAVYLDSERTLALHVAASLFIANQGGALASRNTVDPAVFDASVWTVNTAVDGAAAIDLAGGRTDGSEVAINGNSFQRNTGGSAGAVHLDGYRFAIKASIFTANTAASNTSKGGAISAEHHSGVSHISGGTIAANSAETAGGIFGDGGRIGFCSSVVVANSARTPAEVENVVFLGEQIAIWPWGTVWGAAGAPISYNYTEACGVALSLPSLSLW